MRHRFGWFLASTLALMVAVGGAGAWAAGTEDPGAAPWVPVPRNELIKVCGLDPDLLNANDPNLMVSPFVVIRHGRLCWEGGAQPDGTTEAYPVFSATKTFGAMLFGMVADRSSVLTDMSKLADWLPAEDMTNINPEARMIHVLGMVATNPDLSYGKKGKWTYDTDGTREINKLVAVMDRAIAAEPDRYGGAKDSTEFAQKALFGPLGMTATTWPGGTIGSNLSTSVRDMARLGQLILQRGMWSGRRLISEEYLYRMTHPSFEDANTGYGYLTYVNATANFTYPTSTADQNCAPFGTWPAYPHRPLFAAPSPNGGSPGDHIGTYDLAHTFSSGTGGQKWIVYRGVDTVIATRNGLVSVGDGGTVVDQFSSHKTVWNAMRRAMLPFDPKYPNDEAGFCAAYRSSEYAPDLREPWFDGRAEAAAPAPPKVRAACVSRRRVTITIPRLKGVTRARISVRVDGRPVRVRRTARRTTAVIDLRGRGRTIATVRILVTGRRGGRTVTHRQTRAFRTCTAPR